MQRRNFLKGTAAGLVGLKFSPLLAQEGNSYMSNKLIKNGKVTTAAHWGVLSVDIKDGKVVKSQSKEKINSLYNPLQHYTGDLITHSRVKHTYVRKSYLKDPDNPRPELRGREEFVRVKYEDAIKLVARELKKTREKFGPSGIFAGSYGWKSSGNVNNSRVLLHKFMNLGGGFVGSLGDYSTGASQIIMPHVLGSIEVYEQQTSWPVVLEHSNVVVIWGSNPLATLRISWTSNDQMGLQYFEELKKSGKKLIFIDPVKNETCQFLNARWIAPVPNTDVAMMLGMAYHLMKTDTYDKDFIQNYTVGFDKFKDYLNGKTDGVEKTPAWASKICGVEEGVIKELAELFNKNTTMIISGWGMQRAQHGEQPHWMLVTLCSMMGQIGKPGGGFGLSYHYSNGGAPTCKGAVVGGISAGSLGIFKDGKFIGTVDNEIDENGKFVESDMKKDAPEWLKESEKYAFPVARIAEALLNPGKELDHNGRKIIYPKIDFVYWVGGNPLVHHQQTNEMLKAWRTPRTIVVNEPYWTPTAKFADIVFPTTTQYERNDITMTGDYSNKQIAPMKQLVEKQDEAKDDFSIFADLAKATDFNMYMAFSENGKTELDFIKRYYDLAYKQVAASPELMELVNMPKFEEFWEKNEPVTFEPTLESEAYVRYAEFIEDPILNALGTPSGLIEIYSETIEKMGYDNCGPHPKWYEPFEWLGMKNKSAEFAVVSPHPTDRLHSQLNQTDLRKKYAVNGREPMWINSKDAKKKGIKNGDLVRVFNARGQILAGAVVSDNIKEGVIRISEGAWYDPDKNGLCLNGCVNVLTRDLPTSKLANGNISHTCLANVELYKGRAAKTKAFKAPKFI